MTQEVFTRYKIKYYYAHAYSPYEGVSNENFNRTLREYIPKKTNFGHANPIELKKVLLSIAIVR